MGSLDNPLNRDAKLKVYRASRVPMTFEDWKALGWSDEEAERLVLDTANGVQTRTRVTVTVPELERPESATGFLYDLPHYVRHSPDGFEWGYGGSGPSELARCILIDFLGLEDAAKAEADKTGPELRLPVSYQEFKRRFIEVAPGEGFEISGTQIARWLMTQQVGATT